MKYDFTFYNPTRIHFGKEAMKKLPEELAAFGENILLLYGKSAIKKIGLYDEVMAVLATCGKRVTELGGIKVVTFGDYKDQTFTNVANGEKTSTGLPKSNVLSFKLENGDVVIVRPSGTEPKVKFYFMVSAQDQATALANIEAYKSTLNI